MCSVTLSPSFTLVAAAANVVSKIMSLFTRITGMMSPAVHGLSFSHMEMYVGAFVPVASARFPPDWMSAMPTFGVMALHGRYSMPEIRLSSML